MSIIWLGLRPSLGLFFISCLLPAVNSFCHLTMCMLVTIRDIVCLKHVRIKLGCIHSNSCLVFGSFFVLQEVWQPFTSLLCIAE